ncbi:hypothetical protein [Thermodesulfovibrio yellowstonii]|uniref:Uncharacterized protein n=1 Tax=Thermodesulfovibrio yellowstonii TaxID=28262 RepID=A0A9W6GEU3_9BACT|nr:hypothetical protein [Thermodesulfovibrio islandicus]GLI52581.1 hypothetical protein TISLANDTSLP1_02740 [Thermodesulfovibrio islandicus]
MKDFRGIVYAIILILVFASLSYAVPADIPSDTTAVVSKGQTKITLGGDIKVRGFHIDNEDVLEKSSYASKRDYYDYRANKT